jgi:hypothetical protein
VCRPPQACPQPVRCSGRAGARGTWYTTPRAPRTPCVAYRTSPDHGYVVTCTSVVCSVCSFCATGTRVPFPVPRPPFVSCPVLPCAVRQTANTFPNGLVSALQKHPTLLTVHIPALLSGAGASKVRACPWVPWSQCLCALHPHLSMPCVRLRLRPPSRWRGLPPALPSTAPLSRTCFGSWLTVSVVPRYVADRPAFGRGTSGCTMGEWVWACVCRGVAFRALHPPPPAKHTLTPPPPPVRVSTAGCCRNHVAQGRGRVGGFGPPEARGGAGRPEDVS